MPTPGAPGRTTGREHVERGATLLSFAFDLSCWACSAILCRLLIFSCMSVPNEGLVEGSALGAYSADQDSRPLPLLLPQRSAPSAEPWRTQRLVRTSTSG